MTLYTVTGPWPFPEVMLRHDRAKPATAADEAAVRAASAKSRPPGEQQEFRITLVSNRMRSPLEESADRWSSFGWCSSLASLRTQRLWSLSHAAPAAAVKLELPVEEAQVIELLCRAGARSETRHLDLDAAQAQMALAAANHVQRVLQAPRQGSTASNEAGAIIEIALRYISACSLLGHVARQIEDEGSRIAIAQILDECAQSFCGAVVVTATDDGGWTVRLCQTPEPRGW